MVAAGYAGPRAWIGGAITRDPDSRISIINGAQRKVIGHTVPKIRAACWLAPARDTELPH